MILKVIIIVAVVGLIIIAGLFWFFFFGTSLGFKAVNKSVSNQFYTKNGGVYFVPMGNFFELGEKLIEGADKDSFEVLNINYAKDKNNVYFGIRIIKDADVSTFKVLTETSGKDSKHVFSMDNIAEGLDVESFKYINSGYSKDKSNIYYGFDFVKVENVDLDSFEEIKQAYGKDKNNIYYGDKIIRKISNSIQVINLNEIFGGDNFALKIEDEIYYNGKKNDIYDIENFKFIEDNYYKDSKFVYFLNSDKLFIKIEGADAESFQKYKNYVFKDKDNFYYVGDLIEKNEDLNIDDYIKNDYKYREISLGNNIRRIIPRDKIEEVGQYFKYNNEVYYGNKLVKGADYNSFEYLENRFAKDKNNVYSYFNKINNSDVNSFEILSETFSKDKSNVYFYEKIIENANPETFEVISERFGKDRKNVYYKEFTVDEVKPENFKYTEKMWAEQIGESNKAKLKES